MKKVNTIILSVILIIAGFSFLSYWWNETDITPRVVDIWGIDPFSIGYVYGQNCKKEIQGICSKLNFIDEFFQILTDIVSIQLTILIQPYIPQEYLIEMCGVALGAGVNYNQIFLLNMMPDYMQILRKTVFGCSQFIVLNNTNPLIGPLFGRTLDYFGDLLLNRYQVIVRVHPFGQGNTIIGHTLAGMIGYLTGINDKGLTIGVSQIAPWDIGLGISCTLAIRDILEHNETTEQAAKTFGDYSSHTMGGWCFAILDTKGSAAIVELSNTRNNTIWKPDGQSFLAITNHFISPEMYPLCSHSPQSEARLNALVYLIPQIPVFDFNEAIKLLRSHYDSASDCYHAGYNSICNHGLTTIQGTMGAFIANPKNRVAAFCLGRPCESDFYMITFDPILYIFGPIA